MKNLRLFDSHCHLDDRAFKGKLDLFLTRAADAGVRRVLVAACDEHSSFESLKMAGECSGVEIFAAAGVHPHEAKTVASGIPEELMDLSENPKIRAIGECGLDYYYDHSARDVQQRVFAEQIEWAKRAGKPLLVHLRNATDRRTGDAYSEAMTLLEKAHAEQCGGVIHCFSGDWTDAQRALALGFYISFAGPLTYPKSHELRAVAEKVPLDRILCETDCPYLAPQKYRGKQNEPAYVREVYEKIAELRGLSLADFSEAVWENGENLFNCSGAAHV